MVDYVGIGLQTATVIMWILIGLMVAGLIYFVYYLLSFKNKLVIRDLINNRKIIRTYKWKEQKDKKGTTWLITPFKKIKKSSPPEEAVDITSKGRKYVEAWRSSEDPNTLIWIEDSFKYSEKKEMLKSKGFEPLTTLERELLIEELVKAKDYEGTDYLNKILQIAVFMVPIILVVVIAFTLGDITEALTTYSDSVKEPMAKIADTFERASENIGGIQNVENTNITGTEVPN